MIQNFVGIKTKNERTGKIRSYMFDKSIGLVRKWSEIRVGLMAA